MALLTLEIPDAVIQKFLESATSVSSADTKALKKKGRGKKEEAEEVTVNAESIKEAAKQLLDLTDKETVKEVISEFDVKSVIAASKLKGDDLAECHTALLEAIESAGEEGEEEEESEITVEAVKKAVQAFSKKNGKEEADEILADFDIKSVRSLDKLEQSDLEELYAEVMA